VNLRPVFVVTAPGSGRRTLLAGVGHGLPPLSRACALCARDSKGL
jgi:hypothetical protein